LFEHGFLGSSATEVGIAEYERIRIQAGIGDALVVGYEGESAYAGNNEYILALAATRPWIRPLRFLDLTARPPTRRELFKARNVGYNGFALYLDTETSALSEWPLDVLDDFGRANGVV